MNGNLEPVPPAALLVSAATAEGSALKQLNMADPRVLAWYEAVERHVATCTNNECAGCRRLEERRNRLRTIPGLLIESGVG